MRSRRANSKIRSYEHLRIVAGDIGAGSGLVAVSLVAPRPIIARAEEPYPYEGQYTYRYGPAPAAVATFPRRRSVIAQEFHHPPMDGYYIPDILPVPQMVDGPGAGEPVAIFWFRDSSNGAFFQDNLQTIPQNTHLGGVQSWINFWGSGLGSASNAITPTPSQPALHVGTINNLRSLFWDASDRYMSFVGSMAQQSAGYFAVFRADDLTNKPGFLTAFDVAFIQMDSVGSSVRLQEQEAPNPVRVINGSTTITGSTIRTAFCRVFNAAAMDLHIDGIFQGAASIAADVAITSGGTGYIGLGLGDLPGEGNKYFRGYMCEVLGYSPSPTLPDMQAIFRYLNQKWNSTFVPSSISGYAAEYNAAFSSLWEDNGRSVTAIPNNDPVGAWDDMSGNGYHLGSDNMHVGSVTNGSVINLLTTVAVNGSSLQRQVTWNQPAHLFIVCYIRGDANNLADAGDYLFDGYSAEVSAKISPDRKSFTVFAGQTLTTALPAYPNSARMFSFLFNTTNSKVWVDGQLFAAGSAGSNNPGGITIGSDRGMINNISAEIAHVILFNQEVTGSNLTNLFTYLKNHWNVPYIP